MSPRTLLRRLAEARVKIGEDFRLAFGTLRSNKLRSGLTILGTLIGVCSIIALVSIINGLNRYVAKEIAEEGSANSGWTASASSRTPRSGCAR